MGKNKGGEKMKIKNLILQYFNDKIRLSIGLGFTMLLIISCKLAGIIAFADLMEKIFVKENYGVLPSRITIIIFSVIFVFALTIVKNKQAVGLSSYISSSLAKNAYESLLNAEINEVEKEEIKEGVKNIVSYSELVGDNYVGKNLLVIIEKSLYIFVTFITLLVIKPALALIAFIGLPCVFGIEMAFDKLFIKYKNKEEELKKKNINIIEDSYHKIRNIKLDNAIKYENEIYDNFTHSCDDIKAKKNIVEELNNGLIRKLSVGITLSIVIGVGCWLTKSENLGITSKVLLILVLSIPFIYDEFCVATKLHLTPNYINDEIEELLSIINLKSEIKAEVINNLDEVHSLKFTDVTYINSNKVKVFDKLNFEVKRGEKLGILSIDKEFKDGVFNIITKMIKPKSGVVEINNCDINKINTLYLRDLITSIYDGTTINNDSIINNVYYPLKFDEYKYNDALNKTGLKDIISELPFKENTILNLSNPFDQDKIHKVIFANAFYKDSKIYLLNDATNNYMVDTEKEMIDAIKKLKNKIIIMLTDKVFNIVDCDKVLIYEDGMVVEYGRYNELIQDKSSYLYRLLRKSSSIRSSHNREKRVG